MSHTLPKKMPVYLIARSGKLKRAFGFMEMWARALKGESDHIEVAFVRNRVLYSCYITKWSIVAKFELRSLDGLQEDGVLAWYLLQGISPERELELEVKCRDLVADGKYYFSASKMMHCAMPFRCEKTARMMEGTAQPVVVRTTATKGGSGKGGEASAGGVSGGAPAAARSTYCGALCAEILGFPDPEQYTASDIVILCQERLGAKLVERPVFDSSSVVRPVRDHANIVRASEQIAWLV